MNENIRSATLGVIGGVFTNNVTGSITYGIFMALVCGGAGYLGQLIVKETHYFIKKKLKKND